MLCVIGVVKMQIWTVEFMAGLKETMMMELNPDLGIDNLHTAARRTRSVL